MPADHCPKGHPTPTASHRDAKGTCKECKRDYARERELKARAALDIVRVFEAAGCSFVAGDRAVTPEELAAQLVRLYGDNIQ